MQQAEITQRNHNHAVRFFWGFLIGATAISLLGNVAHAVLPYISRFVVQVGAATVPPIALLAAVHGIALAVRAGASGRAYCWAVSAVAAIGLGAFAVSFLALRDLMQVIGYSPATAWVFPAIIDMAVAVSTLMLVALGDKPARRGRTVTTRCGAQIPSKGLSDRPNTRTAKAHVRPAATPTGTVPTSGSGQRHPADKLQAPAQTQVTSGAAEGARLDADLASELIASGVTTQPFETVIAVLSSIHGGASINAAAKASGINYRTAQRIVEAAKKRRASQLAVAS
jgi:hypothetical protein